MQIISLMCGMRYLYLQENYFHLPDDILIPVKRNKMYRYHIWLGYKLVYSKIGRLQHILSFIVYFPLILTSRLEG